MGGRLMRVSFAVIAVTAIASCGGGAPEPQTQPDPAVRTYFLLQVAMKPDSAVELAKFALGSIEGTVNLPQIRPKVITVSNHYLRDRHGGGQRQVAVIAAIDRTVTDAAAPVTTIEVAAWAVDMAEQVKQRRFGPQPPATALSTNAPATKQPRQVTPRDTTDWQLLEAVVGSFVSRGARIKP